MGGDADGPGEEAGQRCAALASPELYHLLTTEVGWTPERFQRWHTELLESDLLGDTH